MELQGARNQFCLEISHSHGCITSCTGLLSYNYCNTNDNNNVKDDCEGDHKYTDSDTYNDSDIDMILVVIMMLIMIVVKIVIMIIIKIKIEILMSSLLTRNNDDKQNIDKTNKNMIMIRMMRMISMIRYNKE